MGGYIDLTPERLRIVAKTVAKKDRELLLTVADSLEHHEEVIDGLASREREKVQQQMAELRAEGVRDRADAARWRRMIGLAAYGGTYKGEHVWRFRPIMGPHQNLLDAIDHMGE